MIILLIASGSCVAFSLIAEFGFNLIPCFLCSIQRGVHLALFGTSALFLISKKKFLGTLCMILLAAGFFVALYHTLVQLGVLQENCRHTRRITDLASYQAALRALPCKEAWKMFSFPISALNAALTAGLFLFTFFKRKQL